MIFKRHKHIWEESIRFYNPFGRLSQVGYICTKCGKRKLWKSFKGDNWLSSEESHRLYQWKQKEKVRKCEKAKLYIINNNRK